MQLSFVWLFTFKGAGSGFIYNGISVVSAKKNVFNEQAVHSLHLEFRTTTLRWPTPIYFRIKNCGKILFDTYSAHHPVIFVCSNSYANLNHVRLRFRLVQKKAYAKKSNLGEAKFSHKVNQT